MKSVSTLCVLVLFAPVFSYAEEPEDAPRRPSRVEYLTEKKDTEVHRDGVKTSEIAPPADSKKRQLKNIVDYLSYNSGMNITLKTDDLNRLMVEVDLSNNPNRPRTWRDQLEEICRKYKLRIDDSRFKEKIVTVYKPETISFEYKDADIREVVFTIANAGKLNVVIDPDVHGKVTATLKDLPCEDALDVVVKSLGYIIVNEKGGLRLKKDE